MSQFSDDTRARFWLKATVASGVPSLTNSYNVTSITDTATGRLTVTVNQDFTDANWCCHCDVEKPNGTGGGVYLGSTVSNALQAAGAVEISAWNESSVTTPALTDPAAWHVSGFGVQ